MKKIFLGLMVILTFLSVNLNAKRIIVLDPSIVEIIYKLDAQDQLIAISKLTMSKIWPEEKTEKLKSVGTHAKPNIEKIVELKPDLVITSFHSVGVKEMLEKLKIKTIHFKANSIDDIFKNIKQVGEIVGKEENAKKLINDIQNRINKFQNSDFKGKKLAILFSSTPITAFNETTLPGDMLKKLGFINICDSQKGSTPIISPEFILAKNPDFIVIIGGMGSNDNFLKINPVLRKTTAAKTNKIISIPSYLLLRGTPRINEGMDKLYKILSR